MKPIHPLRHKLVTEDLILSEADKGNIIITLNKLDYIDKLHNFINSDIVKLKNDPTPDYQEQIKSVIKISTFIVDRTRLFSYTAMNPSALLYGLPKIHKNTPIRPFVSYVKAACYKICKALNLKLRQILHFRPKYCLRNSVDFVNKIK